MKIRTVFQPDVVQEVDEAEARQLEREGLLLPLEPEAPAARATVTATPAVAPKEAIPDGSK